MKKVVALRANDDFTLDLQFNDGSLSRKEVNRDRFPQEHTSLQAALHRISGNNHL